MRFIIYGVGAIGGTFAAALAGAGYDVVGLARGAMLEAIKRDGLRFRTPAGDARVSFPCYGAPSAIAFRPDDVIVLAMKSQDTAASAAGAARGRRDHAGHRLRPERGRQRAPGAAVLPQCLRHDGDGSGRIHHAG